MARGWILFPLVVLAACGGGDNEVGMTCDEDASLCGTLDSKALDLPVRCVFAAVEANEFNDPPAPDAVWDAGFNAFDNVDVDGLPFPYAINQLDFWDGQEMYVAIVCDSDDDGEYTAADLQGVYGGDAAVPAAVPSTGLDITL